MKRKSTDYIVVHCSATPPNMDIGADTIRQWHVRDNGWSDIGYHDIIRRDGTLEFGRDENEIGAHVKGFNSISVGICLVGGVDDQNNPENNFTKKQFRTLDRCLRYYRALFPNASIVGHRDLNPHKACPSFDVQDYLKGETT